MSEVSSETQGVAIELQEMNAWVCSVGTIDSSPAFQRRETGAPTVSPDGTVEVARP